MDKKFADKRALVARNSLHKARRHIDQGNYSKAFPHYLVFAKLDNEKFLSGHYQEEFLAVVDEFVKNLRNMKSDKINEVYEEALEVLSQNPKLLTDYGSVLFCQNAPVLAESMWQKALDVSPNYLEAKDKLENLYSSLMEQWHYPMLNDRTRNSKFESAIVRAVRSGQGRVLDIGTGTGLLSLMAVRAGAENVAACEVSSLMIKLAKTIASVNNCQEIIHFIPKLSINLNEGDVPSKFSLVVTETFDSGLFGEHVLETLHHAHHNLLADNGRILPASAKFYVAPIQSQHISKYTVMENHTVGYLDINFRLTADWRLSDGSDEPYQSERLSSLPGGFKLLSSPKLLFDVNFMELGNIEAMIQGKEIEVDFLANSDGQCDAIAGWFELYLDESTIISTSFNVQSCWDQIVFPIRKSKRKVYKGSAMKTKFVIKKHIELEELTLEHNTDGNGCSNGIVKAKDEMQAPSSIVRQMNCVHRASISQYVAYYAVRDIRPDSILDLTMLFPDVGLQILKLLPSCELTMMVSPHQPHHTKKMLDLVTKVAEHNSIPVNRISCISSLSQVEECPRMVMTNMVLPSGRLNTDGLLQLRPLLSAYPDMVVLPHTVQLWCQILHCPEIVSMSTLVSDDNVMGFSIAEQVNKLSVTHIQDIDLRRIADKTELSDPVLLTTLTPSTIDHQELTCPVTATKDGEAHCIVYWFVQEYGWNISDNTRDSELYNVAAFRSKPQQIQSGQSLNVKLQVQSGLLDLSLS